MALLGAPAEDVGEGETEEDAHACASWRLGSGGLFWCLRAVELVTAVFGFAGKADDYGRAVQSVVSRV
eukprot:1932099-Pyramimonas_sp.AAC.1